jgi:hypothetical protein
MELSVLLTVLACIFFVSIYIYFISDFVGRLRNSNDAGNTVEYLTLILILGILVVAWIYVFPVKFTLIE